MKRGPALAGLLAALLGLWALWVLEGARVGLTTERLEIGQTPVTRLHDGSASGPVVVAAHGFAGSRQMMRGYAEVLARAGYDVWIFDFLGHGRHPEPMSGDVSALDGTTRLLVAQTIDVIDATGADGPVAVLGHSMASDVLVRAALEDARIGPMVLLSGFSRAIDGTHPRTLLAMAGAWEPGLRDFALETARMVAPDAVFGETVRAGEVVRQARLAPHAEHVAILHSRDGRRAALDWLNAAYARDRQVAVAPTGWAILALLAALTAAALPLSGRLPARATPRRAPLKWREWARVAVLPAAITPLVAPVLEPHVLPVLVADYLAVHLLIYGLVQGVALASIDRATLSMPGVAALALVVYALGTFGVALDRYGANFWPVADRWWIILALAIGAVPFMLADAALAAEASLGQRIASRLAFLVSLAAAIALDPEALFFLAMIAPVIVLFWLTFGLMGRWVAARAGPFDAGLALGLVLAWALGVSFPLFQA